MGTAKNSVLSPFSRWEYYAFFAAALLLIALGVATSSVFSISEENTSEIWLDEEAKQEKERLLKERELEIRRGMAEWKRNLPASYGRNRYSSPD